MTVLLLRTIHGHLHRSRLENILAVLQRIRLQFFQACRLHLAAPLSPRCEGNVRRAPSH